MSLLSSTDARAYSVGSRNWYTLPVSIVAHALVLAAIFAVPLLATDVLLPAPERLVTYIAATVPVPPPPPPPVEIPKSVVAQPVFDSMAAPLAPPSSPPVEPPLPSVRLGVTAGPGVTNQNFGGVARIVAPPAPVPSEPIHVGGTILPPRKIKDVTPIYPSAARAARISGVVLVEAIIGKDGRVRDARVTRSQPLLDAAALDAVKEWRYTPTLLNGQAVEVILTAAVSFAME